MHIEKGQIYTNFNNTQIVRAVSVTRDEVTNKKQVVVTSLRPPGGWFKLDYVDFVANFSPQVKPTKGPLADPARVTAAKHKDQSYNPYVPKVAQQ